ncbi:hypothetical protein DFH06DRAFT_1196803 [Mycena polygramma]|nr:hypothetical protein DFH06DRAFT_1196803 [Mycena polygramma]
MSRRLRSASRNGPGLGSDAPSPPYAVKIIAPGSSRLPGLKSSEVALLRQKQRKLAANASNTLASLPNDTPRMRIALEASLIFAQHEAGSAVCVDPAGWVLTCAHCFGDTEEEYRESPKRRWLLFYTGLAVQVECRAWPHARSRIAQDNRSRMRRRRRARVPIYHPSSVCPGKRDSDRLYRPARAG